MQKREGRVNTRLFQTDPLPAIAKAGRPGASLIESIRKIKNSRPKQMSRAMQEPTGLLSTSRKERGKSCDAGCDRPLSTTPQQQLDNWQFRAIMKLEGNFDAGRAALAGNQAALAELTENRLNASRAAPGSIAGKWFAPL